MKRPYKIIAACLLAVLLGVALYLYAGSAVPIGQPALARIEVSNFAELRSAFNEAKGAVRIVALLSPT